MKCFPQLLRIIKEEIEAIDFGVIKITVNKEGSYVELSAERKRRVLKTPEDSFSDDTFRRG